MSIINIRTSEQVSKYHPDKIADQISDYVLEEFSGGVGGVETLIKGNTVVIAGEVKNVPSVEDLEIIVKNKCRQLKYYPNQVINRLEKQSSEIKNAVFGNDLGAGDQGFVYGYAKRGNEQFLSHDMYIANKVIEFVEDLIDNERDGFGRYETVDLILKGDAKTQVFVNEHNEVVKLVLSVAHDENLELEELRDWLKPILSYEFEIEEKIIEINPAGSWSKSGAYADAGLTGRKIVADQYGGRVPVGGGAFSGKDLSKVDRSGAYALRLIAVGLLEEYKDVDDILIEVGYVIGQSNPYSVYVQANGFENSTIAHHIVAQYDLTVQGLVSRVERYLNGNNITFSELSSGNHMKKLI